MAIYMLSNPENRMNIYCNILNANEARDMDGLVDNDDDYATKLYVDTHGIQPVYTSIVNFIAFWDLNGTLPPLVVGSRYIHNGTTTVSFIKFHIYEYTSTGWVDVLPAIQMGTTLFCISDALSYVYINSPYVESWEKTSITMKHSLLDLESTNPLYVQKYKHDAIDAHIDDSTTAHFGQDLKVTADVNFKSANIVDDSGTVKSILSLSLDTNTGNAIIGSTSGGLNFMTYTANTMNKALSITYTNNSTSTDSGALIISGGVGIHGKIYTADNIIIKNASDNSKLSTLATTNAGHLTIDANTQIDLLKNTTISAGAGLYSNLINSNTTELIIKNTSGQHLTIQNDITSGDILLNNAGLNIKGIINGANVFSYSQSEATLPTISKFTSNTDSTSTSTGAVQVTAGLAVGGNTYMGDLFLGSTMTDFKKLRISNGFTSGIDYTYLSSITANTALMYNAYFSTSGTFIIPDVTQACCGVALTSTSVRVLQSYAGNTTARWAINSTGERLYNNIDPSKYCDMSVDTNGDYRLDCSGNDVFYENTDQIHILSTIQSTSTSTGALIVSGGIGCGQSVKALSFANENGAQLVTVNNTSYARMMSGNVSLTIHGELSTGEQGNLITSGINTFKLNGTIVSNSTSTGALIVGGGVGINGSVYCGTLSSTVNGNNYSSILASATTNNATSVLTINNLGTTTTGGSVCQLELLGDSYRASFIKLGNRDNAQAFLLGRKYTQNNTGSITSVSMNRDDGTGTFTEFQRWTSYPSLNNIFYQQISVPVSIESTSTSTGSIIISGGIGVSGDTHLNTAHIVSTTASTDTSTGALIVNGGIGCAGGVRALSFGNLDAAQLLTGNNTSYARIASGAVNLYLYGEAYGGEQRNLVTSGLNSFKITSSVTSTSTSTGALIISGGGGIGVSGTVSLGDRLSLLDEKDVIIYDSSVVKKGHIYGRGQQVNITVGGEYGLQTANSWTPMDALARGVLLEVNSAHSTAPSFAVSLSTSDGGTPVNMFNLTPSALTISCSTGSTATNTGSLKIIGGVGVSENLYATALNAPTVNVRNNGVLNTALTTDTNGYLTISPYGNRVYLSNTSDLYVPNSNIYIGSSSVPLNFYNTYTNPTVTFNTGTTSFTASLRLVRIGKQVTLELYQAVIAATANSAFSCVAGTIPSQYVPQYNMDFGGTVTNNNNDTDGRYFIGINGSITVWRTYPSANFQNNSAIGSITYTSGVSFTYQVA